MYYKFVCVVSLISLFISVAMMIKAFRPETKVGSIWFGFNAVVSIMAYEMSVKIIYL